MKSRKFAKVEGKLPGPKAGAVVKGSAKDIAPSFARFYPLVVESAHGSLVKDVDGNQFIDFAAGIAVLSTGSTHPRVVQAIKSQADKFIHFSYTDFYYSNLVELSEKLFPLIPGGRKMVYYGNSGAEAIEAAMKLTRNHTKRMTFLAHSGAFHGRTMGALSLTASKPMQRRGALPLIPDVVHFPFPYCYRCPWKQTFPECDYYCVDYFKEQYLDKFVPVDEVAAYFFEPIQGEGGYVPAPPDYFKKMEFLRKEGVLFVDDEIQTGVGRTGKFLGIEHYEGVVPDVVTLAKGIASGLPLGATVAKAEIMESWKPGQHASTFGANPVAVQAALATLDVIKTERLMENAKRMGAKAKKWFFEMKEKYEIVGDVRGMGLFLGVEIVKDKKSKARGEEEAHKIIDYCFQHGALVIMAGRNTLRFVPPLNITEDVMNEGLDIMEEGIAAVNAATKKA